MDANAEQWVSSTAALLRVPGVATADDAPQHGLISVVIGASLSGHSSSLSTALMVSTGSPLGGISGTV